GETPALRLGDVFDLGAADAELHGGVAVLLLRPVRDDLTAVELENRDRHMFARIGEDAGHSDLLRDNARPHDPIPSLGARFRRAARIPHLPYSLISTSTPAARSSFINASTVCGVGSTMSRTRLCVLISNCSRDFLSMCGERLTVNFSIFVGSGIGPRTCAPVRLAVETISFVDVSRIRWSNAFRRIRMF